METKNNDVVEAVEYETPEGQKVIIENKPKRSKVAKEEKPKGRIRNWAADKFRKAGDFLSDDEKVHSLTKKVKRGALVAGIGAAGLVGLSMVGSKEDKKLPSGDSWNDGEDTNYLTDGEDYSYEADYSEPVEVEEVTE